MRTALLALLVPLTILGQASPALAGPDRVTGGVTVPDGTLTGGGADVDDPLPPALVTGRAAEASGSLPADVAQDEAPEPEPLVPEPAPGGDDVEVQVPVKDQGEAAPATVVHPTAEPAVGLAQTGSPLAAVAALGALTAAAGLALRRGLRA